MKPFDQLTRLGKIRRMRKLAYNALEDYALDVAALKFFVIETNTMFQVRTVDGKRFMLRIYSDEDSTLKENRSELFWLQAIMRDTDLKVTRPVARRDGEYLTLVSVPGIPGERRCAVFEWVPGRPLENHLSTAAYYQLGQSMAKLHEHALTLHPLPADIQPKKWDQVFYYPDEPVVYNDPAYAHLFPPERIALIDQVIVMADQVFKRLFSSEQPAMLIHGDLHYWNVHYQRGELYLIDFEDISLGYPIQDIAVTLYYVKYHDAYEEWREAFKHGYASVRPWPDEDESMIETLMAARRTMFVNYVARVEPEPLEFIEAQDKRLARFLAQYG